MTTTLNRDLLGLRRSARGRRQSKSRRFRPDFGVLEQRQLLSSFTWDNSAGGAFNIPLNWIDQNGHHGVPGPADVAIIKGSGFNVAITQPTTVGSLSSTARLTIASGGLTLDGPGQHSSLASLVLDSKTNLTVAKGSLDISGTGTLAGTLERRRRNHGDRQRWNAVGKRGRVVRRHRHLCA